MSFEGTEDAGKILSNDGSCPICDQVLSRRYDDLEKLEGIMSFILCM